MKMGVWRVPQLPTGLTHRDSRFTDPKPVRVTDIALPPPRVLARSQTEVTKLHLMAVAVVGIPVKLHSCSFVLSFADTNQFRLKPDMTKGRGLDGVLQVFGA
jgi:hypothetical protein